MIAGGRRLARRRVLIVGAGPGGAAAALRLHGHGCDVLWVDRAEFPRPKVCGCCLNMAALSALAPLGCDALVRGLAGSELAHWQLRVAGRTVQASLPGGVALSRTRLDVALIEEGLRRGIEFRSGVVVKVVEVQAGQVSVRFAGSPADQRFDAVIWAAGLAGGGVSRWLPWIQAPTGPLGAAVVVDDLGGVEPRTIHMVCGPGGYVGLVRLEDGRIDVAAALHHRGRSTRSDDRYGGKWAVHQRINAILASGGIERLPESVAASLLTTPPLHRRRHCGAGGLLAVGDAAGYIEPFTGEGMAWAIQTGVAAADCLVGEDGEGDGVDDVGAEWRQRYAEMMRQRQWLCRWLSRSLASPWRSRALVAAIGWAPWAVRRAVQRLNAG